MSLPFRSRRARVLAVVLAAVLLALPTLALASVKRGYYIDGATGISIITNAAANSIKNFQVPCNTGGTQNGTITMTKGLKLSKSGAFSYTGKATEKTGVANHLVSLEVTGKITTKATGTVTFKGSPAPCDDQKFSAKYYGVNPKG